MGRVWVGFAIALDVKVTRGGAAAARRARAGPAAGRPAAARATRAAGRLYFGISSFSGFTIINL